MVTPKSDRATLNLLEIIQGIIFACMWLGVINMLFLLRFEIMIRILMLLTSLMRLTVLRFTSERARLELRYHRSTSDNNSE